MLWDTYCLIRLSVIYRGRAIPLVWCVLKHGSAQVSFEAYKEPAGAGSSAFASSLQGHFSG